MSFIDGFQFLSSSLDILGKNLGKDYFKYLSQEFDRDVSDLVNLKGSILTSIWMVLKSLNSNCQAKESFIV